MLLWLEQSSDDKNVRTANTQGTPPHFNGVQLTLNLAISMTSTGSKRHLVIFGQSDGSSDVCFLWSQSSASRGLLQMEVIASL